MRRIFAIGGGGITSKMLNVWRNHNVDILLRRAYERGTVLSGLSAGSICWFIDGIHLINAIHCPHFNKSEEAKKCEEMIVSREQIGIGIDDKCAVEFNDNFYRIHKADHKAKAYKLYVKDGKVIREELSNSDYKSLASLIED